MFKPYDKNELMRELDQVKQRLKILDMIEDRLIRMRKLAEIVAYQNLSEEQVMTIQEQFSALEAELHLLSIEQRDLLSENVM